MSAPRSGSGEAEPPSRTARRKGLFGVLVGVAVLAYASDQVTKAIAVARLSDGQPRPFIGELIRFKLIGNPGAALSLGASNTWVMTAIALGVLVAIVFVAKGLGSRAWAIALGLLLGSAIGNLTDRFVRPPGGGSGHVVDFIDYNRWFIGNVADIWIVTAACLIVLLAVLGIGVDGRRDSAKRDGRPVRASAPGHSEVPTDHEADGRTVGETDGESGGKSDGKSGGTADSATENKAESESRDD